MFGSDTGLYGSLLAKYDHGQARLTNNAFDGAEKLSLKSWGIEAGGGYRWAVGSSRLDLGGSLAWVGSKVEDFTASAITYDFDAARSLRGELGLRYEGGQSFGPYVDARLLHEFTDDNDILLSSGTEHDNIEAA